MLKVFLYDKTKSTKCIYSLHKHSHNTSITTQCKLIVCGSLPPCGSTMGRWFLAPSSPLTTNCRCPGGSTTCWSPSSSPNWSPSNRPHCLQVTLGSKTGMSAATIVRYSPTTTLCSAHSSRGSCNSYLSSVNSSRCSHSHSSVHSSRGSTSSHFSVHSSRGSTTAFWS